MANYRLYRLDGAGKIGTAEWLEADDEDHALELVRQLKADSTIEIWNRNKLVGRVQPAANRS